MLIMCMFSLDASFNRVKTNYQKEGIEVSNNINSIEKLQENLINLTPDIAIIDSKLEFKSEAIRLISGKSKECKFVTFDGNFDILDNYLGQAIENVMEFQRNNIDQEIPNDAKVVFIENKNNKYDHSEPKVIEIEKEVIKEVEVPVIIEKEVLKVTSFKSDSVITFLSAAPTGKSFLSWNIAYALSRHYKVAYVNIDSFCSANSFFGIEKKDCIPLKDIESKTLRDLVNEGYEVNKNLTVYTGEFGVKPYLKNDVFFKVLNQLRSENNIVIIDTASGFSDNLVSALNYSNDVIFVYDLDNSHLKMNNILLKRLEGILNKNNTISVINNVYEGSNELINVDKYLKSLDCFKEVVSVSNCGKTTYDYIYSNTCNYLKDQTDFTDDLEVLISNLKLQGKQKGDRNKESLGKKLLSKFRKGK